MISLGIKAILLSYLITRFTPFQNLLIKINKRFNNLFTNLLYELLSCLKCCSFWITLIMTGNIYVAIMCFIIAFFYDKKLSHWENKIKF